MAITLTLETITPQKAMEYLEKNTANRRIRKRRVAVFARIIDEGRWQITHQGIAMNCDGTLLDGQHRLHGIIESGKTVKMFVARGLPRDAMWAIDQNMTVRTPVDIAGPLGFGIDLTKNHIAVARAMVVGIRCVVAADMFETNEDTIKFTAMHREAIEFAMELSYGDCNHSAIKAVIARAWYSRDRGRLAEFPDVMRTGVCREDGDSAAAVLAKAYIKNHTSFRGNTGRTDLYRKAESAVKAFLDRRPYRSLQRVDTEQFPIPGGQ